MMKEILLQNQTFKVTILPEMGGKIASIYKIDKAFELLYQGERAVLSEGDPFSKSAWGYDDAFPNINPEQISFNGRELSYPDHGEIWRSRFSYEADDTAATLKMRGKVFDYSYEKRVALLEDGVSIKYSIKNNEAGENPCIWAMHCLANCEENMELFYPPETKSMLNVKKKTCLGEVGSVHTYPVSESGYLFTRVAPLSANRVEKYYILDPIKNGVCGAYYPNHDLTFTTIFNSDALPYLGVWINEGGYKGDYNLAFEPTNGFYDKISIAMNNKKIVYLKDNLEFEVIIKLTNGRCF